MSIIDVMAGWAASSDPVLRAGRAAVAEAERLWKLNIVEPPNGDEKYAESREQIDEMIRGDEGLGWAWRPAYVHDGQFEWCGAFAARCWSVAGLPLKPHRFTFWSSTYRLDEWARYGSFNGTSSGTKPAEGGRMIIELNANSTPAQCVFPDGSTPGPGDIVMVGDGTPPYGDHITLAADFDPATGVFSTFEGNATGGVGPDGKRRQGVIKAERRVGGPGYCVRRVIRVGAADIAG